MLAKELPSDAIASDADSADLFVRLDRLGEDALSISMRDTSGVIVLERTIAIEREVVPSLRVAVLLVREAMRHSEVAGEPEPPPVEARPAVEPPKEEPPPSIALYLAPTIHASWWQRPFSPTIGLG